MQHKTWVYNPHRQNKNISDIARLRTQLMCKKFLEENLRPSFVCQFNANNKKEPQCIDIRWQCRGNFIYFKAIYKDMRHSVLQEQYEYPFGRLEYMDEDLFHLAYFRHTGKWHDIIYDRGKSLKKCFELMRKSRCFQIL